MNARQPIGFAATSEKALAYRPNLRVLEEAADDMAAYAEERAATFKRAVPADPDDVFSEDDDDTEDVAELLAARPVQPSGKWVGIGIDACAALIELQKLIGELDFFSAGDTGLGKAAASLRASQRDPAACGLSQWECGAVKAVCTSSRPYWRSPSC
jgi:hypothetical protein